MESFISFQTSVSPNPFSLCNGAPHELVSDDKLLCSTRRDVKDILIFGEMMEPTLLLTKPF